jgi:hypothetical protein
MSLDVHNSMPINGLVLSPLTRALLISDVAGCVQLETEDTVLIKVLCPTQDVSVYPQDLQAAFKEARTQGAGWLTISNMEGFILPECESIH